MKPFHFFSQVEAEIAEALDWYEARSARTADRLIELEPPQVLSQMHEVYDLGTPGYWHAQ